MSRRAIVVLLMLGIGGLAITSMLRADNPPPANPGMRMTPAMRAMMMQVVQEYMIMSQNASLWTPVGLVMLQGNRVLHYRSDLTVAHTVTLPLPPMPAMTTPPAGQMPPVNLRSRIPAQLLWNDTGLMVVRGQQIVQLDRNFAVVRTGSVPDLPPLTPAETAAICPLCAHMQMMMSMMGSMGGEMGGTPGTPPAH